VPVTVSGSDVFLTFDPIPLASLVASASATPDIVPTGGTTNLTATTTPPVGTLTYQWRGYRDDGTPYSDQIQNPSSASASAGLVFPGRDFYFFVHVSDDGVPPGSLGHDAESVVRVHETDGPVARIQVSPPTILAAL